MKAFELYFHVVVIMLYKVVVINFLSSLWVRPLCDILWVIFSRSYEAQNYPVSSLQVKESLSIPVVANGDIKCESDVRNVHQVTGVDGNVLSFLERLRHRHLHQSCWM